MMKHWQKPVLAKQVWVIKPKKRFRFQYSQEEPPDVSIPGVRQLLSKKYGIKSRLVWSGILIICVAFCFQQFLNRLRRYLSNPVNVDIGVGINQTLVFPTVTICPFYPLALSDEMHEFLNHTRVQLRNDSIIDFPSLWPHLDLLGLNMTTVYRIGRIHPENLEIKPMCNFDSYNCTTNSSLTEIITFTGTCWRIQIEPWFIEYEGPSTGITITVSNMASGSNQNWMLVDRHYWGIGFTIYLHDRLTDPTYDAFLKGSPIMQSSMTVIALQLKEFALLNTRTKPCADGKSASDCHKDCLTRIISKGIQCRLPFLLNHTLPMCNSTFDFENYYEPRRSYYEMKNSDCSCPRRCREVLYSKDTHMTVENESDVTTIKVHINDNRFELLFEEWAYDFAALLSDVGGLLGFLLGISILSIAEVLEVTFYYLMKRMK